MTTLILMLLVALCTLHRSHIRTSHDGTILLPQQRRALTYEWARGPNGELVYSSEKPQRFVLVYREENRSG